MPDNSKNSLPVMEIFSSIQGEGHYSGESAIFIRLGGCDVGCHWCDVKDSWDVHMHELLSITQICESVEALGARTKMIIITGGEPVMYPLSELTSQLSSQGYQLHLETSGAYDLTGDWHWICLSPKKWAAPKKAIYERADELKVVICNKDDFNWAMEESNKVTENCKLYLQPEWSRVEKVKERIVEFIKNNTKWMISLQQHKYLNIR